MSQNFLRPNDVDYDEEEDEEELDGLSDEEGGLQVDDIYIPPPAKPACSTESTGPRLIITKIINEFFKSYGRKEIVGPFHHRMNAIIGPNGSGKSNIIDSILFVLGYRASKIRCKKLSVLIHNSEKFMNVEACTVAVHFALIEDIDDNNFRVVPGSEFVISRTAHLDNTSFYSLNGKRVQFKDVARLLKQHGVDLDHNRFLILQGEVEQISLMKPKAQNEHETGMLEYLEDVIGTTRYKEPLKKLEDRVESLTEQRMEKLNRVRISQKTLEELKGPMQEAVEHLKMENAVAEMKNVLYQSYILDLKGQLQEKETARDDLLATQNEANETLKAIGDEIKASDAELKKEMKSYEKVEEKKNTISAAFNVASNRDSQLQADMTETNKKRKKTKELLAEEQKKLLKLERAPEENQRTIVECEKKIEQMSVKKEKLEQERLAVTATIRADTQHLQDRKDKLLTDLLKLNEAVVTTKSAFNLAETELQMCLESQRSEQTKLENLQREQQQSQNLQSERTIAVDELKAQIPAKERALADARRELAGIKSREGDLVDDLRRKRMRLEESRSSMQATSSRGRVLDALMKMKREGKCPGLFGRLGDLGAIDKKYDVAVSTACGPLDNIVVDTVETAQWCIEHLKKYNIGVATFIALKNQEHLRQQASTQLSTPENAPRLFDLIQIEDERVRPAFYYALRNTLVADDLDQACRIAYGSERYRVVTLKGELIETSGTMSGGGRTVSKGRMGQSVATSTVSEADLETMARELNELEDIIRGMRTRQNELETLINQLEPEVREMKMNCDKYARELEALKQHLPRLSHHIKEQERKCKETKADPRQVQRMEAVVKERREESERAEEAASGLQNQVEELTREIEEKSIGKLKKLDKELRETTNIIDKCKKEVTRLNVATKTSERNVRISKEKIESFEQEIAKCESDLIAMKEERATIENEAKILLTCIEELTVELANKEEGYSHIKQKIDKLKKEENKMKMDKVELDEKVKKIVGATKEIQMNIERWKSKIKQLTLHEIPDSEVPQLTVLTDDELRSRDVQQMELELHSLEEQLKTSKPAFTAIAKYKRQQEDFVAKSRDLDQISEKKKQMQDLYDSVKNKRKDEFLKGYNIIRLKLKEMYQTITLGGDANFELVDSFDPFNEGVQFNVRPPKKSWKIISNLSGGEKTLSSLALVFALHYYKPSPFYIMDEIDAALDFKNVSIIANFIKERTKNAQFVIISLRDNMFSLGDILIGVYKVYNCTQTVAINPSEYDNETNNEQRNGIEERTNDTNYQQQSPQLNIVPT